MLTYNTMDGKTVSIDPLHVTSVLEIGVVQTPVSLLSGGNWTIKAVEIILTGGERYRIPDPQGIVAHQIREGKRA